jgi:nitrite reductase/ring-hydroxylating ferredoxin subunit
MSSRRDFLKTSCLACAQLTGLAVLVSGLQSCSSIRVLTVASAGGSVQVPFSAFEPGEGMKIVRIPELVHDILFLRQNAEHPRALLLQCTHEDARLIATNSGLHCNLHGSTFSFDGEVTNGPAIRRLKEFPVMVQEGAYLIQFNS